jgi:hypothetical protein
MLLYLHAPARAAPSNLSWRALPQRTHGRWRLRLHTPQPPFPQWAGNWPGMPLISDEGLWRILSTEYKKSSFCLVRVRWLPATLSRRASTRVIPRTSLPGNACMRHTTLGLVHI